MVHSTKLCVAKEERDGLEAGREGREEGKGREANVPQGDVCLSACSVFVCDCTSPWVWYARSLNEQRLVLDRCFTCGVYHFFSDAEYSQSDNITIFNYTR